MRIPINAKVALKTKMSSTHLQRSQFPVDESRISSSGDIDPEFYPDNMIGITAAERLRMQQLLNLHRTSSGNSNVESSSSTGLSPVPTRLALVQAVMDCIDTFQLGQANDSTYLLASNALRDLYAFVQTAEKTQKVSNQASFTITIEGELFIIEDYHDASVFVRASDSSVFDVDSNFLGVWDERTSSITS